jgi:serine/threonine-protein kinase
VSRDRWEEVVALFEEALQHPVAERDRFLDTAAKGDGELRAQVAALLHADAEAHPLFNATPERIAVSLRDADAPSLAGRRIGAYTLVREIGRGGMATVYHGEDAKHRRPVALKLLDAATSSALGSERFRREIDVVARLQHPNILPLYDSGDADGLLYYVMPLVGGGTLRDRIAREGPLPIGDVRHITTHIAAGLDYAHRHGVVHRDVKPANVLLDEEHATIADFGIAQRSLSDSSERLTTTGLLIGTPAYMSPEQATGAAALDARTDVYALGCVIFEMLTGMPPFRAKTSAMMLGKHVSEPVPSAHAARGELPRAVDAVFRKALAKDPAERFASTRELAQALDRALAAPSGAAPSRLTALGRRRWIVGAAVVVLLAAVAAALLVRDTRPMPSIAVLPFVNMSADSANEYFSDGVTEELTGQLAQLGRVRVTPRTTAFAYKGRTGDITRIGRELGVSRILEGSVRREGDRVIFAATLYDAESGDRLWSNRYERSWGTLLALQAEIAGTIAQQLRLRLSPEERARLTDRHTVDPEAYQSYLKGRYHFETRTAASMQQALVHFQRAVALDSMYARAYAGLADTYSIMAWTGAAAPLELFPLAERATRRALAIDSTIAETFLSLGLIHTFHTWDWEGADRAISRALALDSTSATAWFFHAWHFVARGRPEDALAALQKSRQLDPFSLITNARIGTVLTWMGRLPEAEAALRATLDLDPAYPVAQVQLARVLSLLGRHPEAEAALPADSLRFGSYESGIAGVVFANAGKRDKALAAARALEARPYVPAEGVAGIYAALGDTQRALTWLERAYEAKSVGLIFLAAEPMYAPLRNEPRFRRLTEQLKLR